MLYVLTIAGSDPSGGAGVQADLSTFKDMGVAAISAITAITAQDDVSVLAIHPTPADVLTRQIQTACKGRDIAAVKIGMVATRANARAIALFLRSSRAPHVVIDPVFYSSSGTALLDADAYTFYRQQMLTFATVITPNLSEAGVLAGMQVAGLDTMRKAAQVIYNELMGLRTHPKRPLTVIVKGGHLSGDAIDVMYDGKEFYSFPATRIEVKSPRGTGCRFASALAACLAKGESMNTAVTHAKEYLIKYISAPSTS